MESGARLSWCIMGTVLGTVGKGTHEEIPIVQQLTSKVVMKQQWPQGGSVKECWMLRVEGSSYRHSLIKLSGSVEGNSPAFLSLNMNRRPDLGMF